VLRTYVREQESLTLEEAIHRMTGLSAEHLGLRNRGFVTPGAYADLVLFDPSTVSDHAEIGDPHVPSTGVAGVWVGGVRVWDGSAPVGETYPGRVIRRGDG
jgi:N-acyl-D-aspartate/D-glutamate deacylase